jgi:hypothetical protein
MSMSQRDDRRDDTERIAPLLALAREAGSGEVAEQAHQDGKERLLTALAAERVLPAKRPWLLLAASVFCVMAAIALVAWPPPELGYTVSGSGVEEGYLAPDGEPARVAFEDGSVVTLRAGARGRIAEVTAVGARVVLERGEAQLSVVPLPEAAWWVEAGPYTVEVTGTAFTVDWSPDEKTLRVEVEEGSVEVHGPLARAGVALAAGERLVAGGGALRIEKIAAVSEAREARAPKVAPVASSAASAEPTPAATTSWSARLAAGQFATILREGEARGIDTVLGSASLEDLVALADAARYQGRSALARRALMAQRRRFAASAQAATAAFLLGRMADEAGASDEAIGWYDAHLSEGGAFAAEALGRKMLAEKRAGRIDAARSSARRYLAQHASGPHAEAARAISGAP